MVEYPFEPADAPPFPKPPEGLIGTYDADADKLIPYCPGDEGPAGTLTFSPAQLHWYRQVFYPWWLENIVARTEPYTSQEWEKIGQMVRQARRDAGFYKEPDIVLVDSPFQMAVLADFTRDVRNHIRDTPLSVRKDGITVEEMFRDLVTRKEYLECYTYITDDVLEAAVATLGDLVSLDEPIIPTWPAYTEDENPRPAEPGVDLSLGYTELWQGGNLFSPMDVCVFWGAQLLSGKPIMPLQRGPFRLFCDLAVRTSLRATYEDFVLISQFPTVANISLDCDDGPAWAWQDGLKFWWLDGREVNEQIVMRPHEQTVQDILDEENEEVRRIRLDRYGWARFMRETKAEVLDKRLHDNPELGMEILFRSDDLDMTVLVVTDGSTPRQYGLFVDEECTTVEEAQQYLSAFPTIFQDIGLDMKLESTYPVTRS